MKLTLLAGALAALATAVSGAPSKLHSLDARQDSPVPGRFTVMALRSASPIHFLPVQAAGQKFWLGGYPATYCPEQVGDACPPGNKTVITGLSYLDVLVPGGQQIYVDPNGALSFTQAHSVYIPPGSLIGGFTYTPHDTEPGRGTWGFNGGGATGWMACPDSKDTESPRWQVFAALRNATVPTGNVDDCLGFTAMALQYTSAPEEGPAAWQYT
ncbi:hypothetical protein VTO42DRAFT_3006 [Malbranchea cinnamomea]